MALRRIVQSLGSRTFKSVYAARFPGSEQRPESLGGKASPHAEKDTYIPAHHLPPEHEAGSNWEKIKDDISAGRPGGQQSQQPWMEKAKETLNQASDFIKEKTSNINTKTISETAENLKEGAKDKLNQASDYLKSKADETQKDFTSKDFGATAKEKFEDIKEGAKDKLQQAQDFVRKQTISDAGKKVKDSAKDKYEDLKFTAEQKKKITEEAWDFSKMKEGQKADLSQQKLHQPVNQEPNIAGERAGKKFFHESEASAGAQDKGILDSVKETAANAAEWVKDKFTPSGAEKPNLNTATDEKVQSASEKLKSDLKANDEEIRKESISSKANHKNFTDDKVDKNY